MFFVNKIQFYYRTVAQFRSYKQVAFSIMITSVEMLNKVKKFRDQERDKVAENSVYGTAKGYYRRLKEYV